MIEKNWKYYTGIGLFCVSFLPYVFVFLILPFLEVSGADSISMVSSLLILSELLFLAAVAILGKPFIKMLKERILSVFKRTPGPVRPIGRLRHTIGLILFFCSLIMPTLFLEIFLFMSSSPLDHDLTLYGLITFDLIFIASIFILGEEFWDKLKKLFEWEGTVSKSTQGDQRVKV